MKKDTTKLFCDVDDFTQAVKKGMQSHQLSHGKAAPQPTRKPGLDESEIITIILLFQESPCRNFKYFYQSYLQLYKGEFPGMPSYQRFVALMPRVLHLLAILLYCLLAKNKGISYIDATSLAVCHPKRVSRNKVFRGLAKLGKTTKGYFFGFKLHIIINEKGDLIRVQLTPGNVDDRFVVPQITESLTGLLFGDKGYISKELFLKLYRRGLKLVTGIKKNMKNKLMIWREKILLRKRGVIETVFDYLKNKLQLEHTRHRSPFNMLVHVLSTLIVYQLKPSKPSISQHHLLPHS
jgi:DDE family transposase